VQRPGRLLVIDSDESLVLPLARALQPWNVHVEAALSAIAALARLESGERFDLVLCEVMLPGMDGIEFQRRLSLVLAEEAKRLVFVVSGARTVRVEQFLAHTSNAVLEAPIDAGALHAMIERRMRGPSRGASVATDKSSRG
jgi:CheY-like chemotaxis protein